MVRKRTFQNQGPEVVDMDALASMSDDELLNRLQRLDNEREGMRESRVQTREWEIEIAYVRREQQLRRARREAHDLFLQANRGPTEEVEALSDEFEETTSAAAVQA